jgi:ABC-2 type transport system ATP-binding protein
VAWRTADASRSQFAAGMADTVTMAHRRPAAIEARQLTKAFGPFVAAEQLTFRIMRGEIVALTGPAGAGKTTAVRMLTAFMAPTSGQALICGDDVQESRLRTMNRLGYVPESQRLHLEMTPAQMLRFFGEARQMDRQQFKRRLADVVAHCGIASCLDRPIGGLPVATRQRVSLAQALLHDPDVLILDEPILALEPGPLRQLRGMLYRLRGAKTILVATSTPAPLEPIIGRVLTLHKGRLTYDGTPADARARARLGPTAIRS